MKSSTTAKRVHEYVGRAEEWGKRLIPPLQEGIRIAPELRWMLTAGDWTEDVVDGWKTEILWEQAVLVMMALDGAGLFEGLYDLEGSLELRRMERGGHRGDFSMGLRDLPFTHELARLMVERPPGIQSLSQL